MHALTGTVGSCWTVETEGQRYPELQQALDAETVVIGAGIVGLSLALRLVEAGHSVIVLEGLQVGRQVTGRSTAKITAQHGLIYRHLVDSRGHDIARDYAEANRIGILRIGEWIAEYGIECDYQRKPAYAYTEDPAIQPELEAEAVAARDLGLTAEVLERAPLPFETAGALHFPDQAQFNPTLYLIGLAGALSARGGQIFENSRVQEVREDSRWRVETSRGRVAAQNVVVATNLPIKSPIGMSQRTQARTHVAMAFRAEPPAPIDGMFIKVEEPTRSLRTGSDADGPLLIALGPRFPTGQDGDVAARFVELENWVRDHLAVGDLAWRWCNEDYDTADRVPYAGEPDPNKAPGFFVATGFNAWGISNGSAVGIAIAEAIAGRELRWRALYDPARPYPEEFHKSGDSQSEVEDFDRIGSGEGGVVTRNDEKLAIWRDAEGALHVLSAECTHQGCTLTWNNADLTWDCPCHGSIFAADGTVIHGPAQRPLERREL